MATIKELQERKNELATRLAEARTKGEESKWNAEAREAWDKIDADFESVNGQLKEEVARSDYAAKAAAREAEAAESGRGTGQPEFAPMGHEGAGAIGERMQAVQDLRAWMRGKTTPEIMERATRAAQKANLTNVPSGERFANIRLGQHGWNAWANREFRKHLAMRSLPFATRAMGSEQANLGQEFVPSEMVNYVEEAMTSIGSLRARATVIRTEGAGDLQIPTSNDLANKGEIIAENFQASEEDVPTDQVVLKKYQYSSKIVRIHNSLLLDPAQDTEGVVGRALGVRIARIQNEHWTVGTGVSQPFGMLTQAADSGVTLAGVDTIAFNDMIDVFHSLNPAYLGNASWELNNTTIGTVKKIADSQGAPLWMPSLVPDAPDTILGKPYYENPDMPAPAASAKSVAFGDMSKYTIRDMRDMFIVRLVERYAEFNQTAFLLWMFSDGNLVDAGAGAVVYATQAAA